MNDFDSEYSSAITTENPCLQAALNYAAQGLPVFPCHGILGESDALRCTCGNPECNHPGVVVHPPVLDSQLTARDKPFNHRVSKLSSP